MFFLDRLIGFCFTAYTVLLMVRIIGSWIPSLSYTKFMRFVSFYTDPYLNIFRRWIPPIGGVLDLSPILAFFGLQLLEILIKAFVHQ